MIALIVKTVRIVNQNVIIMMMILLMMFYALNVKPNNAKTVIHANIAKDVKQSVNKRKKMKKKRNVKDVL